MGEFQLLPEYKLSRMSGIRRFSTMLGRNLFKSSPKNSQQAAADCREAEEAAKIAEEKSRTLRVNAIVLLAGAAVCVLSYKKLIKREYEMEQYWISRTPLAERTEELDINAIYYHKRNNLRLW